MAKKNKITSKETQEEKELRWKQMKKFAKSFAHQVGLDKKAKAERIRNNSYKDNLYD